MRAAAAAGWAASPRFSVSLRPIIAPTEAQAWDKARAHPGRRCGPSRASARVPLPEAVGAQRLVEFARQAEVHDKRLWTPIAAAAGGQGNTTALVGTPEQVAESLLDYYDLGVTTLLIRGFDPLNDADRVRPRADPAACAPRSARRDRDRAAA